METSQARRRGHQDESSVEPFKECSGKVTPPLWPFPIAINPFQA